MSKRTERNKYFYRQAFTRLKESQDSRAIFSIKTIKYRMPRKARKAYYKREWDKLMVLIECLRSHPHRNMDTKEMQIDIQSPL